MEFYVIKIYDPLRSESFVLLRVPCGSLEQICRWFLNDNNHLELSIVDRGITHLENDLSKLDIDVK